VTETVKALAYLWQGEENGNHGEPEPGSQGHVDTVPGLQRDRRAGADYHGKQRDKEQRGLGVEGIGQEAQAKGRKTRLAGPGHCFDMNAAGAGPQTLEGDPGEIQCTQHLENAEQKYRLLDQKADAQQRVADMNQNAGSDSGGGQEGIPPALKQGLSEHHGKVRPRACNGQQVNQCDCQKFRPVIVHSPSSDL